MALSVTAAAVLVGCGAAQPSSGERTRLTSEVAANLRTLGVPSDVAACAVQQGRGLPLASLRQVAQVSSSPVPTTGELERLLTTCVQQGREVAALRALWIQKALHDEPAWVPLVFRTCVAQKVNATEPGELVPLLFGASAAKASAQGDQLAITISNQCLEAPAVLDVLLTPIEQGHYSPAFKACAIRKIKAAWPKIVNKLASLSSAAQESQGAALGRSAAAACEASGAIP